MGGYATGYSGGDSGLGTDTEQTGTITGTTVTLTFTPYFIYGVFKNGQRLTLTTDYTISGKIITFLVSLESDIIVVSYKYLS